jgi:hypothetical protein
MEAHQARNTKTAIMFAICLSFLIFAGSTFKLIGNLIVSGLENQVAADMYAISVNSRSYIYIDEEPITKFLQQQKDYDGAVIDWTYTSTSLKYILRKINDGSKDDTTFSDMTGYKTVNSNVHAIQRNYLQVTDLKYYMPNELDQSYIYDAQAQGFEIERLANGEIDAV